MKYLNILEKRPSFNTRKKMRHFVFENSNYLDCALLRKIIDLLTCATIHT